VDHAQRHRARRDGPWAGARDGRRRARAAFDVRRRRALDVPRDTCGDDTAIQALVADGDALDPADRAIVEAARKRARDAATISEEDVDVLGAHGLSDNDIADIVFAVAARCFFATVLDGMGVSADHQLRAAFEADIVERLTVGRPMAAAPTR
jgi:alkylhydroperoxidase family enzyme